ncbi:MAG: filamentous hemagglutinin family protein [Pseudomonadota bacterium]
MVATLQNGAVWAAAPLPAGTLPVPAAAWVASGSATRSLSGANLTITQQSQRAVLDWDSFNVSAEARVRFDQPNSAAAALNRIHDANPSVIQGQLTANGEVFLINANGILFDRGSSVNVGGLVASSLGISQDAFNAGLLSVPLGQAAFSFGGDADAFARSEVKVEAGASITTSTGGRVMLFAPNVKNAGSISTPQGQAVLAGGDKVFLALPSSADLRGFLVEVDPHASGGGGSVVNDVGARVHAERGNVTLVASRVRQDGVASATSSVSLNGSVRLLARDGVTASGDAIVANNGGALTLGAGSVTAVTTDADPGTARQDAPFSRSQVELAGRTVHVEGGAQVIAPGGRVTVSAQRGALFQADVPLREDVRLQIDPGARIDVSGEQGVAVELTRNVVGVELRGDELKDSPLQRDGALRNKTVFVDAREGTPLADVSGAVAGIETGTRERNATGGDITLRSEGDLIVRAGSVLDVSGGSVLWQGGLIQTTVLVGADGRLYDIASADPNRRYLALAGRFGITDPKWGVTREFRSLPGRWEAGFLEGRSAGGITVQARRVVLDGDLRGMVVNGPQQRALADRAMAGRLILGNAGVAAQSAPDFMLPDLRLDTATAPVLGEDFSFGAPDALTPLPPQAAERLTLDPARLVAGGIAHLEAYSNGEITVAAPVRLDAGGSLALTGRRLTVESDILAPAGQVRLATRQTAGSLPELTAGDHALQVAGGVRIAAAGVWSNDRFGGLADLIAPQAGSVVLSSVADLELAAGSVLDVRGGGHMDTDGSLSAGAGGSISLSVGRFRLSDNDPQTSRLTLGGELLGYGLETGGALTINASQVQIGGEAPATASTLHLAPDLFTRGGFTRYSISGQDGVEVADGVRVAPRALTLAARADLAQLPAGATDLGSPVLQDLPLRPAASISLTASSPFHGDLRLGDGAVIDVDPGAEVALTAGRQLTVLGAVQAPAGSITLTVNPGGGPDDAFLAGQSIWLGAAAALRAAGTVRLTPDAQGLRRGEVLAGGSVTLDAGKGYVITEAGSVIDVSGAHSVLDITTTDLPAGGAATSTAQSRPLAVGSAGGQIAIRTREGGILAGALRAQGGAGAIGGHLDVTLDRPPVANPGFPTGAVRLELGAAAPTLPASLATGADIPDNGVLRLGAAQVATGGFADLSLTSRDRIALTGTIDLSLPGRLLLNAPELSAATGQSSLAAQSIQLANLSGALQAARPATPGDAGLTLSGGLIELVGEVALQGIDRLELRSGGDLRLRGVLAGSSARVLAGRLHGAGELRIDAAQVYPSTLSRFRLEADRQITLGAAKAPAALPLSAAGQLTLAAPTIDHSGILRAPFGSLALAGDAIHLRAGSVSSVSGAGLLVPFGRTELTGREWAYALVGNENLLLLDTLPNKVVSLTGNTVEVAAGAQIDLRGGGDLLAHEFLPGPGGSRDLLAPANADGAFAVLPALGAGTAPFDHQIASEGAIAAGELVWLGGVPGLPAGYYSKLPARYALLPGAFLVTPQATAADVSNGFRQTLPLGDHLVAGREARQLADGIVAAPRTGLFSVQSGSVLAQRAEYAETRASQFFATRGGTQVADAGRLAITATAGLELAGELLTTAAAGGRGAELDLAATRLAVLGTGATAPGPDYLRLDAQQLSALNVDSLLLGATRQRAGDQDALTVLAQDVWIDTAGSLLLAPELIVAAQDSLQVRAGSRLTAQGGNAPGQALQVEGDGALLRLASQPTPRTTRVDVKLAGGDLDVAAGAELTASGAIELDATGENRLGGALSLGSGGTLAVAAGRVNLGDAPAGTPGLLLDNARLAALASSAALALRGYDSMDVYGAVQLGGPSLASLTLETGRLRGFLAAGDTAQIQARELVLGNPNGSPTAGDAAGATGTLRLLADRLVLADGGANGDGSVAGTRVSGVGRLELTARDGLRFADRGRLSGSGDIAIAAGDLSAEAGADHAVAADGALTTTALAAPTALPAAGVGARLELTGETVDHAARLRLPSGQIRLTARSGDVLLRAGSLLDAAGIWQTFGSTGRASPGGSVTLRADAGNVTIASGARGANAGRLSVTTPNGAATLDGELLGDALPDAGGARGKAGEVNLDLGTLTTFSVLNNTLEAGGFGGARSLRLRSGDLLIGADDTVTAQAIDVAVDAGALTVAGKLDARGGKGGQVRLHSQGEFTLAAGALIDASARDAAGPGSQGRGGQVELGSATGLTLTVGSAIDVSAGAGAPQGGQVLLRAPRAGTDVAINTLGSEIRGAGEVTVEATRVYSGISTLNASGTGSALGLTTVSNDNAAFMAGAAAIAARLGQTNNAAFHVRPGVEVRSTGNLTLANDWNLSPLRAGGEPGVLTLRAAGDLLLNNSLSDGFSTALATGTLQTTDSWSYRLVAGADLAGADPLTLRRASDNAGDLVLAAGKLLRTGTGRIEVAAARDLRLASATSAIYTAGKRGPVLPAGEFTPPPSSEFPTGGGDLVLNVGRDINATAATQLPTAWLFRQGRVNADGSIAATNNRLAWWINFPAFAQGVATLGGGDVTIRAGGDVRNLGVSLPTNARLPSAPGSVPDPSGLVLQGGGDLDLRAGGDIGSALLFLGAGEGRVQAGGDIASARTAAGREVNTLALLADAQLRLAAGGSVALDAVLNPTVLTQVSANVSGASISKRNYFFSYSARSGLDAQALTGDVHFTQSQQAVIAGYPQNAISSADQRALRMLPPNLSATAFAGDLSFGSTDSSVMFPAANGQLSLLAAGDLSFPNTLAMSDQQPGSLPSLATPAAAFSLVQALSSFTTTGVLAHSNPPLHAGDGQPARIAAGGDVIGSPIALSLALPKAALIEAGGDVRDLQLFGQNLAATDLTRVSAGGDVVYSTPRSLLGALSGTSGRIEIGGPGRMEVLAGGDVDLGSGGGIVSRGNLNNPFLPEQGAAITVMAGLAKAPAYDAFAGLYLDPASDLSVPHRDALLAYLRSLGQEPADAADAYARFEALDADLQRPLLHDVLFAELRATGRAAVAEGGTDPARYRRGLEAIATLFPGAGEDGSPYRGDINLFFSQIRTDQGGNIDLFAPGGQVNAGLAGVTGFNKPANELGIVTAAGGSVRGVVDGDFLVNQSRVFTLGGGDILLWSSNGNIDAGRGAKSAAATPPPRLVLRGDQLVLDTSRSVSGSGIGVLLSRPDIVPGDVDLIAPNGEVNAGDAGIRSAGNLTIAAPRVVGADNIQVGGISTGVPVTSTAVSGSLAGAAAAGSTATKAAADAAANSAVAAAAAGTGVASLGTVVVDFIGFDG